MTIGLDIEGTVTAAPAFFGWLSGALIRDGHRVVVITMQHHRDSCAIQLQSLGISYTELVTPEEEVFQRPDPERWKSEVCRHLDIDVMFDDSMDILEQMPRGTSAFRCVR